MTIPDEALANLWLVLYRFPNYRRMVTLWSMHNLAIGEEFVVELDSISEPFSRTEAIEGLKSISNTANKELSIKFLYDYIRKNYNLADRESDYSVTLWNLIHFSKQSDVDYSIPKFPQSFLELLNNVDEEINKENFLGDPMNSRESYEKIIQVFELYFLYD